MPKSTLNEAELTLQYLEHTTMKLQQAISQSYRTFYVNGDMRKQLEKACTIIENIDTTIRVKVNRITDKVSYDTYVAGIYAQLKEKKRKKVVSKS